MLTPNAAIISRLVQGEAPDEDELADFIGRADADARADVRERARGATERRFGTGVYIRGLVEIGSYCANDCFYCGIRRSNGRAARYRLEPAAVLECCRTGHALGFRTFVLQGGEDSYWNDDRLAPLVETVRRNFPDSAITLSLGERSRESYKRLFAAGADRYLLRHETACPEHYARLHPEGRRLESRVDCLRTLGEIGYQVGSGFMVGTPGQTALTLAKDALLLRELGVAMAGIGPFIPHADTPFSGEAAGRVEDTLLMIGLVRLLLPNALVPATTALATLAGDGRERGLLSGANVVMPNLSPIEVRGKYSLYDGKLSSDAEAAENLNKLKKRLEAIGRQVEFGRGDYEGSYKGKQTNRRLLAFL